MTRALDIAIVGYGIAGIAAAIELRNRGHRVAHFERRPAIDCGGAGLLLHPPTLALLDRLGLGEAAKQRGDRIDMLIGMTTTGREIMNFRYDNGVGDSSGIGILRATLMRVLSEADSGFEQVEFGRGVASADISRGIMRIDDGSVRGPFDLMVAADGAGSCLRWLFPEVIARARTYESAAVVCVVDDPARIAGSCVTQTFEGTRHVSIWPVGSPEAGGCRQVNVSINVPLASAAACVAEGEWKRTALRICPWLHDLFRESANRDPRPIVYRYHDVVLRRHALGRLAFIGDAAHSMSPQLGQGARLALHDARCLADALDCAEDSSAAQRLFHASQIRRLARCQRASRILTPWFQSDHKLLAAARDRFAGPIARSRYGRARMHALLNCDDVAGQQTESSGG